MISAQIVCYSVCALVAARAPEPGPRGPYKKKADQVEPWMSILLVVAGLFALWLAFVLFAAALAGAVALFLYAAEQGFIGVAAYIACWVLFFPVMLVIAIIVGLVIMWASRAE